MIKLSNARQWIALAAMLVAGGNSCCGKEFLRVIQTPHAHRLQTAIVSCSRDQFAVDLVAAIHLADVNYYQKLNTLFTNYDRVLFEMVGGEHVQKPAGKQAKPAAGAAHDGPAAQGGKQAVRALTSFYAMLEQTLGLVGQASHIDYTAPNFIHADLTLEEFSRLQTERGESLLSFMVQAGMAASRPAREPKVLSLFRGLMRGDDMAVKRELIHQMAEVEAQVAAMPGQSVILDVRNARCLEVLEEMLGRGHRKIAIFYGAAHMADLRRQLEAKGFSQVQKKWLTAWKVSLE